MQGLARARTPSGRAEASSGRTPSRHTIPVHRFSPYPLAQKARDLTQTPVGVSGSAATTHSCHQQLAQAEEAVRALEAKLGQAILLRQEADAKVGDAEARVKWQQTAYSEAGRVEDTLGRMWAVINQGSASHQRAIISTSSMFSLCKAGKEGPFLDMSRERWVTATDFLTCLPELGHAWDELSQAKGALQTASEAAEGAATYVLEVEHGLSEARDVLQLELNMVEKERDFEEFEAAGGADASLASTALRPISTVLAPPSQASAGPQRTALNITPSLSSIAAKGSVDTGPILNASISMPKGSEPNPAAFEDVSGLGAEEGIEAAEAEFGRDALSGEEPPEVPKRTRKDRGAHKKGQGSVMRARERWAAQQRGVQKVQSHQGHVQGGLPQQQGYRQRQYGGMFQQQQMMYQGANHGYPQQQMGYPQGGPLVCLGSSRDTTR